MMDFVTCGQMKILEKRADEAGLSYYQMMENAGTAAFEIICSKYDQSPDHAKVIIFCGKGNNGGDGFVVARKFHEAGAAVTIILVDGTPVSEDAVTNFNLIKDAVRIIDMSETESPLWKSPDARTSLLTQFTVQDSTEPSAPMR